MSNIDLIRSKVQARTLKVYGERCETKTPEELQGHDASTCNICLAYAKLDGFMELANTPQGDSTDNIS